MRIIHIIIYHRDLICGQLHNCLKERILQKNEENNDVCFPINIKYIHFYIFN